MKTAQQGQVTTRMRAKTWAGLGLALLALLPARFPALAAPAGQPSDSNDGLRLKAPLDTVRAPDQPAGPLDVKFAPCTGETYIAEGRPDVNFDDLDLIEVGYDDSGDPKGKILRGLAKFDISRLPPHADISEATLNLYLHERRSDLLPHEFQAFEVTQAWEEETVTWNSQPGYGTGYETVTLTPYDWGYQSFDVTDLVKGWYTSTKANNGIMIRGPEDGTGGSNWRTFLGRDWEHLRDTYYPPFLQIKYLLTTNTPPSLSDLPDQWLLRNGSRNPAIDLWQHTSDTEHAVDTLDFSIVKTPEPRAGVSLRNNRYIDINPDTDWFGQTEVVVEVQDPGGLSDQDAFEVVVLEPGDNFVFIPLIIREGCARPPYLDGFGDPNRAWPSHNSLTQPYGYANSAYQVMCKGPSTRSAPRPDLTLPRDHAVEVTVWLQGAVVPGAAGIVFDLLTEGGWFEGYEFIISPQVQEYRLDRRMMGDSKRWPLIASTHSSVFDPNLSASHLRVEREGTSIRPFLNGTHVATAYDASHMGPGRDTGRLVLSPETPPVEARYDTFRVDCPWQAVGQGSTRNWVQLSKYQSCVLAGGVDPRAK